MERVSGEALRQIVKGRLQKKSIWSLRPDEKATNPDNEPADFQPRPGPKNGETWPALPIPLSGPISSPGKASSHLLLCPTLDSPRRISEFPYLIQDQEIPFQFSPICRPVYLNHPLDRCISVGVDHFENGILRIERMGLSDKVFKIILHGALLI